MKKTPSALPEQRSSPPKRAAQAHRARKLKLRHRLHRRPPPFTTRGGGVVSTYGRTQQRTRCSRGGAAQGGRGGAGRLGHAPPGAGARLPLALFPLLPARSPLPRPLVTRGGGCHVRWRREPRRRGAGGKRAAAAAAAAGGGSRG